MFSWTPTATGTFTFKVRVTDNDVPALFDEESITVTVTANLVGGKMETENETAAVITETLYPNPVHAAFNITLHQQLTEARVTIMDVKGSVVSDVTYDVTGRNNIALDASDLENGLYVVRLETGGQVQFLKFVKN